MKQNEITALADERKMFGYTKQLSHEELAVLKDEMSDQSIKERELKIELKEMTKEIKDRMKPITKVKNELLEKIKAKAEFVDEMCSIHFRD